MRIHLNWPLAVVTLVAVAPAALAGGATRFNPSITVDAGTNSNVDYADPRERSDETLTLGLELPVERVWDSGSFSFRYRPSYIKHADTEALDRDEHRVELNAGRTLGRLTTLDVVAGYFMSQEQGGFGQDEIAESAGRGDFGDTDGFLTERVERESTWASVSIGRDRSPRWRWNAGVGWTSFDHGTIDDFSSVVDDLDRTQDRDEYGASLSVSRVVAPRTSVGVELEHREYDLQGQLDEQSETIALTLEHELSRRSTMTLELGTASRDGDDPTLDTSSEFHGSFAFRREFRNFALSTRIDHSPSAGGHLPGTSTDTRGSIALGGAGGARWTWNSALRVAQRDPTDPLDERRVAMSLEAGAERDFGTNLGLAFGTRWVDESSDRVDGDRSALRLNLGLRWYPRGRAVAAAGDTP